MSADLVRDDMEQVVVVGDGECSLIMLIEYTNGVE